MPDQWGRPTFSDWTGIAGTFSALGNSMRQGKQFRLDEDAEKVYSLLSEASPDDVMAGKVKIDGFDPAAVRQGTRLYLHDRSAKNTVSAQEQTVKDQQRQEEMKVQRAQYQQGLQLLKEKQYGPAGELLINVANNIPTPYKVTPKGEKLQFWDVFDPEKVQELDLSKIDPETIETFFGPIMDYDRYTTAKDQLKQRANKWNEEWYGDPVVLGNKAGEMMYLLPGIDPNTGDDMPTISKTGSFLDAVPADQIDTKGFDRLGRVSDLQKKQEKHKVENEIRYNEDGEQVFAEIEKDGQGRILQTRFYADKDHTRPVSVAAAAGYESKEDIDALKEIQKIPEIQGAVSMINTNFDPDKNSSALGGAAPMDYGSIQEERKWALYAAGIITRHLPGKFSDQEIGKKAIDFVTEAKAQAQAELAGLQQGADGKGGDANWEKNLLQKTGAASVEAWLQKRTEDNFGTKLQSFMAGGWQEETNRYDPRNQAEAAGNNLRLPQDAIDTITGDKKHAPQRARVILEKYKDVPFVKRILEPDKYPKIETPEGTVTHKLGYTKTEQGYMVFPLVQYDEATGKLRTFEHWQSAAAKAFEDGNVLLFQDEADAKWFSEGEKSWKAAMKMPAQSQQGEEKGPGPALGQKEAAPAEKQKKRWLGNVDVTPGPLLDTSNVQPAMEFLRDFWRHGVVPAGYTSRDMMFGLPLLEKAWKHQAKTRKEAFGQ